MNIVDSSGWLEYFTASPNARHFAPLLKDAGSLIVPVIVIYEVFKVVMRERGENDALQVLAAMQGGKVVPVDPPLAVAASRISLRHGLPMADSMILAIAEAYEATIWTQDAHFKNLPRVRYFGKK